MSQWNRSNTTASAASTASKAAALSPLVKYVIYGTAAAMAVGGLAWYSCSRNTVSKASGKADGKALIQDVGTDKGPGMGGGQPPPPPPPKKYKDMTNEEKLKVIRDKYGDNIPENMKSTVYFLENPPQKSFHPARSRVNIFKRQSDRKIASTLLIEPGAFMLRPMQFDDRFDADFKAALLEPIEILPEDTPEDKELKTAVMETRKELAERMERGEKPSEVMSSEMGKLTELSKYKTELQKQLMNIRKDPTYTDADIKDFVTAANEMLSKKGIPGFKMPSLLARQASLKLAARKQSQKTEGSKK